jgi:FkbM family methyltransferase
MNVFTFPYVNQKEILVIENSLYLNSCWVHPSTDNKWDTHFVWDLNVIEKFVDCIQDNFTILDIGANTGSFALSAKYYSNTTWHLFEPDPLMFSILKENLKVNKINNVILYDQALSSEIKDTTLKICPSHRGLNTLAKDLVRFSQTESIDYFLKTNTIDNLFYNTKIDLIKIDTEGSEYDIIKGGIETIKKYKPKILLEYNFQNINQGGHTVEELNDLISEIEYETFWFDNSENLFIQSR